MKILIIEGSQSPPSFVGNLINELLKNGVQVGLLGKLRHKNFTPQHTIGFTRLVTDYLNYRACRLIFDLFSLALIKPNALWEALKTVRKQRTGNKYKVLDVILFAKLYAYNPDIVHFQWAAQVVKYHEFIRAGKYKCIVSLRGMHINVSPRLNVRLANLYKGLFPLIDKFHAVSNRIGREAEKYNGDADKITVIYSMLPDRLFGYYKKDINPVRKPLSILSIGRFHWQKGYRYGIEAVYLLKQKGILVNYTIVAGSDIPEEDLFLVHQFELSEQVKFIDQVDYQQVPSLLVAHSVLLLPSIAEGIANVVLEAMAVGLPVISSNAGGMSEVIMDKVTGWLVPVANPVAISEAVIDYLSTDEKALLKIRENAYTWVRENHDANKQILKFVDFYREVLHADSTTN